MFSGLAVAVRCRKARYILSIYIPIYIMLVGLSSGALGMELVGNSQSTLDGTEKYISNNGHDFVFADPALTSTSFAIRSQVRFAGPEESATVLWLIGLAAGTEAQTPAPGVAWVKDTSGWWPKWRIELNGAADSAGRVEVLKEVTPQTGHTYETLLSYNQSSGTTAVRITDLTTSEVLCAGAYSVQIPTANTHPYAGVTYATDRSEPAKAAVVETLAVYPYYAPVGLQWSVEARQTGEESYTSVWMLQNSDEARMHAINPLPPADGELRVYLENNRGTKALVTLPAATPEAYLPIDKAQLALGQSRLVVEYAVDGQPLLRDSASVTVGSVAAAFMPVETERNKGVVKSSLTLISNSGVSDLQVRVPARIFRMTWDEATQAYTDELYSEAMAFSGVVDLSPQQSVIPLQLALPQEPGLWKVQFAVQLDPALGCTFTGAERLFSTYAPAAAEGRPFTIAVLPDTQYHTRSYPDILTRQMQWIAENAQSRNIVFALHVGDITDNNSPMHWERARDRIGILGGVVPYALAAGNHDILVDGVATRDGSLIDAYFPQSLSTSMQGTYEAGKVSNSYHTFTVGDEKYLVMTLEFGPRDGVLEWANQVVSAHPDHKVIIVTHTYTSSSGRRVTAGTSGGSPDLVFPVDVKDVNDAEGMWSKFVSRHANVLLVVSGHIGMSTIPWNIGIGVNRNKVYEFLIDYQGEPHGGNGWLTLFEFQADGNIKVSTYSPYLGIYKTDKGRNGYGNQMLVDTTRGWISLY